MPQPWHQQKLIDMANDGQPNGSTVERTGMGKYQLELINALAKAGHSTKMTMESTGMGCPWLIDASKTGKILADNRASGFLTNLPHRDC